MNTATDFAETSRLEETFQNMRDAEEFHAPAVIQQADPFGGSYITAQAVGVRRDEGRVLQLIKARANANGQLYFYSWEVKKKGGGKELIEGGSIKLANDLARLYGNCLVDTRSIDCGDHWMIYARFTDLETGFSMTRPFRQRKTQKVGKGFEKSGDSERALDMMMQIGTSKAIRNVIANSLSDLWVEAWTTAKGALVKRVAENPEGARKAIISLLEVMKIELIRAEHYTGRKVDKWTAQDMAKLWSNLASIKDGLINAEDVFPAPTGDDGGDDNTPNGDRSELDKFEEAEAAQPEGKPDGGESTSPPAPTTPANTDQSGTAASSNGSAPKAPSNTAETSKSSEKASPEVSEKTSSESGPKVEVPTFLQKSAQASEPEQEVLPPEKPAAKGGITAPRVDLQKFNLNTITGCTEAAKALEKTMMSEPIVAIRREIFIQSDGRSLVDILTKKSMGAVASNLLKISGQ